jgi:menaquinone-dependent protoporphyrinogen oxidase
VKVLVAFASQHGATGEIAERIAKTLTAEGHRADLVELPAHSDVATYEAFVIGSAVYMGHWRKEAVSFVHEHERNFAGKAVWLFSSGPLGTSETDPKGRDLRAASMPKEAPDLQEMAKPRGHRVFFGALDSKKLSSGQRLVRRFPGAHDLMPEGDFRDWAEVGSWAKEIASQLPGEGQLPAEGR